MLVGRHFWPHGAVDAGGHLVELATGLKLAGLHVSVVTPKYSTAWADQFAFREIGVYRPVRMFRSGWTARGDRSSSRYIRYLREWLAKNPLSCDLFFCDAAREESIATVEAARQCGVPVVVRIGGNGSCSDIEFFMQSRAGKRCRSAAMDADAVVLGNAANHRNWIAMGGKPLTSHRIPIGVGPALDQGLSNQSRLRRAMARINGDLYVPDHCAVVLSVEGLRKDSGVTTLVDSAFALSQKINTLHFWFVGDGPLRDSIYERLKADGLRQSVAMPGSFAISDDVFAAADLMVHIGDEGFEHQIPTAIAAALPLIVANTPTARQFFAISDAQVRERIIERLADAVTAGNPQGGGPLPEQTLPEQTLPIQSTGQGVWWFDPGRPKTLRFAIQQITSDLETARQRAQQLRRIFQQTRSGSESIQQYVRLFRHLVDFSAPNNQQSPSTETAQ
ncbi:MAG: glycosyltransferase [Planctomycetales bacterium]|nr:glycosyltransferase [Planctomycetales bacterium]